MQLLSIWREFAEDAPYYCISSKSATGKWRDHFFKRSEFRAIPQFLRDNADRDLYFCPHGFTKPRREKQYAVIPRLLWSDMDAADPHKVKPAPSIAIESSPGRYVGLWFMDKPVTEELNRRLAYTIGADKSGWDLSQVLRIPGTTNYKYDSQPKTRFLWTDGQQWSVKELEGKLIKEVKNAGISTEASDVWRRVSGTIKSASVRQKLQRELTTKRIPTVGKRSEVLFALVADMFEAGIQEDDALTLIKCSVWNKFAGRRNEDDQLRREWQKALDNHFTGKAVTGESNDEEEDLLAIDATPMSEIKEVDFDWIWHRRIARGMATIIEGDPEAGKSYITQMIAARVHNGEPLPCEEKGIPTVKGPVVYFDLENKRDTVTIKRLRWNGFEPSTMKHFHQIEAMFSLGDPDAMARVYEVLEEIKPVLVVFDTMNTYLGKANTSQGAEAQQIFVSGFNGIAKRFNCGVVVLRHLTKGARDKAIYMGQGNIALMGVARFALLCSKHPEDPDMRVLASNKNNNTKRSRTIEYRIIDAATKEEREKSKLIFEGFNDYTADEIVSAKPEDNKEEKNEAQNFLREVLDDGQMDLHKVHKMADSRGIAERTLQRAASSLRIIKKSKGFGKDRVTLWELPDEDGD